MKAIFTAAVLLCVTGQSAFAMNCSLLDLTVWSAKVDGDALEISETIKNSSGRAFRMAEGATVYTDPLGRRILGLKLDPDLALADGEENVTVGYLDSDERLASIEPSDVKAEVCLSSILWSDGQVEKF